MVGIRLRAGEPHGRQEGKDPGDAGDVFGFETERYTDEAQEEWRQRQSMPAAPHTAVIAYFHRLTSLLIKEMAEAVDAANEEEGEDCAVVVRSDELENMGLHVWSEADKASVRELVLLWFDRPAEVYGASVECCSFRICSSGAYNGLAFGQSGLVDW